MRFSQARRRVMTAAVCLLTIVVATATVGAVASDGEELLAPAAADGIVFTSPGGAIFDGGRLVVYGTANDANGVARVEVMIRNLTTKQFYNGKTWQADYAVTDARVDTVGATSTKFGVALDAPAAPYFYSARTVDTNGSYGQPETHETDVRGGSSVAAPPVASKPAPTPAPKPAAPSTPTTAKPKPTPTTAPKAIAVNSASPLIGKVASNSIIFTGDDKPITEILIPGKGRAGSLVHRGGWLTISGKATDEDGVNRVIVVIRDTATKDYFNGDDWQKAYATVDADLASEGATSTGFRVTVQTPANGIHIAARSVDAIGTYGNLFSVATATSAEDVDVVENAAGTDVSAFAVATQPPVRSTGGSADKSRAELCAGPVPVGLAIDLHSHDPNHRDYDETYDELADTIFCHVSSENSLKRRYLQSNNSAIRFGVADSFVDAGERYGASIRGHALVWNYRDPLYIRDLTPSEIRADMNAFITTMMVRYDTVDMWDVVNEPFDWSGRGYWRGVYDALETNGYPAVDQKTLETTPPRHVIEAFEIADRVRSEHNLDTTLWLNEANALDPESPKYKAKAESLYSLVKWMVDNDVPIDGVGFQAHLRVPGPNPVAIWGSTYEVPILDRVSAKRICGNLQRYRGLGLDVAITEADIVVPLNATPAQLQSQIDGYKLLYQMAAELDAADLTIWGLNDSRSWYQNPFEGGVVVPGWGHATLLDDNMQKKNVYNQLRSFIASYNSNKPAPVCP